MAIYRVCSHTDNVGSGSTYVAITGTKANGLDFIEQALQKGATRIVAPRIVTSRSSETDALSALCKRYNAELMLVDDARVALAELSAQAYGHPSRKLALLAVTGTDGKTTSCYLLYNILRHAGKKVALLSGVQHIIGDEIFEADLTTEKPDYLQHFFHLCVQQGIQYVVMEVAAQAFTFKRIIGLLFDGAVFTNLAHEHGESYSNLDGYFAAKLAILQQTKPDAPLVINIDSEWGLKARQHCTQAITSGFGVGADYQVTLLQAGATRQLLELKVGEQWVQLTTPLIGEYNAKNIAGAAGLAHQLGAPEQAIIEGVATFAGASGRLERYQLANGALAIVDYAHTAQAYQAVLPVLKKHARKLFVVFGAAGGKDKAKRPMMGKLAVAYADMVVLTMDNPRQEDPTVIIQEIMADMTSYEKASVVKEVDRAQAIRIAYEYSKAGDIIAIFGKGLEQVQIIGSNRIPYSDVAVVRSLMG